MKAIIEYKNGSLSVKEVKDGDYDKESHEVSFNIVSDKMLNINAEELLKVVVDGTVIYDDRKHGKNTQTSQLEEDVVKSSKEGKLFKVVKRNNGHYFSKGEIVRLKTKKRREPAIYENQQGDCWSMVDDEVEEITLDGELYQYVGKPLEFIDNRGVIKFLHQLEVEGYSVYYSGKGPIVLHDSEVRKIEFK